MDKFKWAEVLLNSNLLSSEDLFFAFILCQYTDANGENCYRTIEFLSKKSKRCENTARKSLGNLVRLGFVKQELASSRRDIPKDRGYVWSLIKNPIHNNGATIEPSSSEGSHDEPSLYEPSRHEGSYRSDSPNTKKSNVKNNLNNNHNLSPHGVRVSTTVHYSDTSKGEDRSTSSATSRACATAREETTYSAPPSDESMPPKPIQPAEVAAIKQALEAALPTLDLSGVKGLYGLAQAILAGRDGLDEAKLYVEQRGLEWTQRLLDGQRYPAYAIVRLIAKDAPSWRPPQALKSTSQPHTAAPQATADAERPWWWGALMRALLDALKAHRSANTAQSRAHAHQLAGLLHHLQRAHEVRCEANALHIVIEDAGPTPEELALVTSYIPVLLDRVAGVELRAAHLIPHTAHRRAS